MVLFLFQYAEVAKVRLPSAPNKPTAMKGPAYIITLSMLLAACSTLRDTASAVDDVYDIPDRTALAEKRAAADRVAEAPRESQDYYDPAESQRTGVSRDYYDMAYNDPYYYNYGRFGFGGNVGGFGPNMGMGLSYGWPTSFGSMGLYYGSGTGMYGYNPYWSNSWMSGYGYWPSNYGYGYDPYGYYGYGNYGPGWGGYGMGYGPYYSPLGRCYGCYEPISYGNTVYMHRPSLSGGSTANGDTRAPRMGRNPASLMPSVMPGRTGQDQAPQMGPIRPDRVTTPRTPSRNGTMEREPVTRPSQTTPPSRTRPQARPQTRPQTRPESRPGSGIDFNQSPSRSSGGSFGGGGQRVTSPRPGR